jgi:SAM-dependent methyltransferase
MNQNRIVKISALQLPCFDRFPVEQSWIAMKRNWFTPQHSATPRDYRGRMLGDKAAAMVVAMRYDREFWDGDRRFGYGGYRYDGRWKPMAENLVKTYGLTNESKILDLGCGKAHLLKELRDLLPKARLVGLDVSRYALETAPPEIRSDLKVYDLHELPLPYADREFDLVLSLNVLHNFHLRTMVPLFREVERVASKKYVVVESYRTPSELVNLQCWALTCKAFYDEGDWQWIFSQAGYTGDYEHIFFEGS